MKEIWKDIPGYYGIYEASTFGRIRTKAGKTTWSSRYNCPRIWRQRILQQKMTPDKHGRIDPRVSLYKDGVGKTYLVSRLVAATFLGNSGEGLTVNHIDGNPMNNRIENLEFLTLADNIRHGFNTGLYAVSQETVLVAQDGTRRSFRSMSSASRFLGRNVGYISGTIKAGRRIKDACGNAYEVIAP